MPEKHSESNLCAFFMAYIDASWLDNWELTAQNCRLYLASFCFILRRVGSRVSTVVDAGVSLEMMLP